MNKHLKDTIKSIKISGLGLIICTFALVLGGSHFAVKAAPENEDSTNPVTGQSTEIIKGIQTGGETEAPTTKEPEPTPEPAAEQPAQAAPVVEDVTDEPAPTPKPAAVPITNDDGSLPTTGPAETLIVVVAVIGIAVVVRKFIKSRIDLKNSSLKKKTKATSVSKSKAAVAKPKAASKSNSNSSNKPKSKKTK